MCYKTGLKQTETVWPLTEVLDASTAHVCAIGLPHERCVHSSSNGFIASQNAVCIFEAMENGSVLLCLLSAGQHQHCTPSPAVLADLATTRMQQSAEHKSWGHAAGQSIHCCGRARAAAAQPACTTGRRGAIARCQRIRCRAAQQPGAVAGAPQRAPKAAAAAAGWQRAAQRG